MIRIAFTLLVLSTTGLSVLAQSENSFINIGQEAPELKFPDPQGNILKLSEINKGRYVLLDCWASWCGPCRNANPMLVSMYKKYSGLKFKNAEKGFTIVSFSFDDDKDRWKAAIEKDKLEWPYHFSDLKKKESAVKQLYGISYIPQAFLIDPSGHIVGKYNHPDEVAKDLEKYLER